MVRNYIAIFFFLLISCDDGDLEIRTIDFNNATVEFCETVTDINSTFFFKLNSTEALILELQSGLLKNEPSEATIVSSVPSQSQVTYRTFSGDINRNYFCDQPPPAEPIVVEEILASGGEVWINTVQSEVDTTIYEHTIELNSMTFINSRGERITNLNVDNFGTITTIQEE